MALPDHINDREYRKFVDIEGDVYVKVTGSNFSGEFTPGGLKNNGKLTTVELISTGWRPLPATPYVHTNGKVRAFIGIQNRSGQAIAIAFPDDDGTAPSDGSFAFADGWYVQDGGEIGFDVSDGVVIYGRSESSTCEVKTKELA